MSDEQNHSDASIDEVGKMVTLKPNVVLIGIMGCGKSTIAELLAHSLGFGVIDIDDVIEKQEGKEIAQIFQDDGENGFRRIESEVIQDINNIRSHVISVGGGAVLDDENWADLKKIGTTVWINTAAEEIARRIYMKPDEIRRRPLLAELVNVEEKQERQKLLTERLKTLISQRGPRYGEADVVIMESYSTPETTNSCLVKMLYKNGLK